MIDLHSHTTASDGTDSPARIVALARDAALDAFAITDHDTLAGYDDARAEADRLGIGLICGLELSTRVLEERNPSSRSVHILGYFFSDPGPEFRGWLDTLRTGRRARNAAIAENLRALGLDVRLEEAEAIGCNITGRPHFAHVMRRKGYVRSLEEAFHRYLGEQAPCYVEREDPSTAEGIRRIHSAGGVSSLAHAIRLRKSDPAAEETFISRLVEQGLDALEIWHSDHDAAARHRYMRLAAKYGLGSTGGSDYHGANKPAVSLGRGRAGEVAVPSGLLDDLRGRAANRESSAALDV